MALLELLMRGLGINARTVFSGKMKATGKASELILNLCLEVKATTYLSGEGGKEYLEEKAFAAFHLNRDVLDPGAAGSCLLCRPNVASLLVRSRDNLDRMPP